MDKNEFRRLTSEDLIPADEKKESTWESFLRITREEISSMLTLIDGRQSASEEQHGTDSRKDK